MTSGMQVVAKSLNVDDAPEKTGGCWNGSPEVTMR